MKKFFKEAEREKEKNKIIELSFGVNFEDIKENFEEVDPNGDDKIQDKSNHNEAIVPLKEKESANEAEKKKKKKNKKK